MSLRLSNKLAELIAQADAYKGSWKNVQFIQEIKMTLWDVYDPDGDLIYPTVSGWDDLLLATIDDNGYESLNKEEVLSMLFGLHHRNRIVEGLWWSMFERGVTQKLLGQLLVLDTDKY
jgi:hypothetical protein